MNLNDVFSQIESPVFAARLSVVSGFSRFYDALSTDETAKALGDLLLHMPNDAVILFTRLNDLLTKNREPDFAHPYDVAIAAYLFALARVDQNLTAIAAQKIIHTPRLWWAKRMAEKQQAMVGSG
jgi:hypothetical protein